MTAYSGSNSESRPPDRNLIEMLRTELAPMRIRLRLSDELGLPSSAKEAVALAVLADRFDAWAYFHRVYLGLWTSEEAPLRDL